MLELTELRKKGGIDPQAIAIEALGLGASDKKPIERIPGSTRHRG
ncbi:hypothetical protein [Aureimonas jatrophae]|uniref:Uncharacterized protein n=1 Tax=Aureimonas jatrophae TaxID=1166073 RepID=A0A1H0M621_9HYPH|nr:hypothetical protein [Aureimonas jatrophae]MBB3952611.1 hypothetical protein [Aureimonas jatrophae]SDO75807.1 hypothetical protein SAMN05192530_11281 [Aureimonas jatrophae]